MHRSKSFLVPLAVLCCPAWACDFMPAPPAPSATPEPAPDEPVQPIVEPSPYRYGVVEWEGLETDCPLDGAWVEDELGVAMLEGDRLTVMLETAPELTGTVVAGNADVAGEVQFPGETGATIDCVVAGKVNVGEDAVAGEVTERMSSVGDLNCSARARFTLLFDE